MLTPQKRKTNSRLVQMNTVIQPEPQVRLEECQATVVSIHTSELRVRGWYRQTCLSLPVIFLLTVPRLCFFCGSFLLFVFHLCLSYCRVFFMQPFGHLLVKGWPLGSLVYDVFLSSVTFSYGVLRQVWYLIVSISDLCLLPYLHFSTDRLFIVFFHCYFIAAEF